MAEIEGIFIFVNHRFRPVGIKKLFSCLNFFYESGYFSFFVKTWSEPWDLFRPDKRLISLDVNNNIKIIVPAKLQRCLGTSVGAAVVSGKGFYRVTPKFLYCIKYPVIISGNPDFI